MEDAGGDMVRGNIFDGGFEDLGAADLMRDFHAATDAGRIDFDFDQASHHGCDVVLDGLANHELVNGSVAREQHGHPDEIMDELEGFWDILVDASVKPVGENLHFAAKVEIDFAPIGQAAEVAEINGDVVELAEAFRPREADDAGDMGEVFMETGRDDEQVVEFFSRNLGEGSGAGLNKMTQGEFRLRFAFQIEPAE